LTFLFDGARAGKAAVAKARTVCQEAGLFARVAVLPDGTDPDDFVRKQGPEALGRVLKAAHGMPDYLLEDSLERVLAVIPEDVELRSARMEEVRQLLASEEDPAVRATLRERADMFVSRLGVPDAATFEALYQSIRRTADQPRPSAEKRPAVRPGSPWHARSRDQSDEVPLRILGALLDYPELLGMEEVVSGLAVVEGDVAAAISAVRQAWEDSETESSGVQGRRFREQVLAKVASSIHGFAAARLAVPEYDSAEDARSGLLENIRKLDRLQQKPQRPEVVAELRRAAASGDVAEEDALLLAHQNRLVGELERVLSKREHQTPVKR
jgi:DNA primase